jgi:hypothetical protein
LHRQTRVERIRIGDIGFVQCLAVKQRVVAGK